MRAIETPPPQPWFRSLGDRIFRGCAGFAVRRPWVTLALSLLLTVLAAWAATRLTVNTSPEAILAPDLPFRQIEREYRAAFPQESERIVAVIDAPEAEQAEALATRLAESLRAQPSLFEEVEVPGASAFFRENALLFLTTEELDELSSRLARAQPALSVLSNDPSLRGLASLFNLIRSGAGRVVPTELSRLFTQVAETVEARAGGSAAVLPWRTLFEVGADRQSKRQLVLIRPVLDNSSLERAERALNGLRAEFATLAATEAGRGTSFRVTGDPALRQQELNSVFSGALAASILSFVLVTLSLVLGIRSWRLIAALLITLVIGTFWATGLAAVFVGQLNLISVAFTVLFFGLGVDFGTHLALRYIEEARAGVPPRVAILDATIGEGPALSLAALCGAIGFLAFVPTDYVGLAELGIISALGMAVALVISLTLLPALIMLFPPRGQPANREIGLGRWIQRNHRAILAVAVVGTLGAAALAPRAQLDVNPLNLQDPATEPVRTYRDLASDPETSPYALNVLAPDLETARSIAERLKTVPGVSGVRTVETFVPENQDEKLAAIGDTALLLGPVLNRRSSMAPPDDAALTKAFNDLREISAGIAAAQRSPELAPLAARVVQALDAFAQKRGTEPATLRDLGTALTGEIPVLVQRLRELLAVSEPVGIEQLPEALRHDWIGTGGSYRVQVLPDGDISEPEALKSFADRVQAVAPRATGAPVSVTEAGRVMLRAFAEAIAYTTIAIALIVAFLRRRLSDVVLILLPLGVAAVWTVAASAALDVPFNFANIIVIPLLIGLGVSSSVHIVVRGRELSGDGSSGAEVLETSTPLAVLVAQLNTVAAFATLAISSHRGLNSMGILLGIAILFVLIAALICLPSLMIALERRRARAGGAAPS